MKPPPVPHAKNRQYMVSAFVVPSVTLTSVLRATIITRTVRNVGTMSSSALTGLRKVTRIIGRWDVHDILCEL